MRNGDALSRDRRRPGTRRGQSGLTYITLIVIVALLGLLMAWAGPRIADQQRREAEADLLRIGALYANAIGDYYRASPGSLKRYPASLDDLLLDARMLGTVRYMRRLYADPLQPGRPWGVIRGDDGTIRGVYSMSTAIPFRQTAVDLDTLRLAPALHYSDWHFVPVTPQ
jgi:type II secretory pathway pseudopilin PulG